MSKNKKGGVVTNTVFGVGGLVIAVITLFVIVGTLFDADLFSDQRLSTTWVNVSTTNVVNFTGTNFGNDTFLNPKCSITTAKTPNGTTIASPNYTVDNCIVTFVDGGEDPYLNNSLWIIDATTTYAGNLEYSVTDTKLNMTDGTNNVSEKIPTILLIVAVVFLFGALVLLMRNARVMGVDSGGGSL